MLGYCEAVRVGVLSVRYFCDWKGTYYASFGDCYNSCLVIGGSVYPVSYSEFLFLLGLAGVFAGVLFGKMLLDAVR